VEKLQERFHQPASQDEEEEEKEEEEEEKEVGDKEVSD
jgi:hypothetical protein